MRTLTPEQCVAEAAEWYDREFPGWWTKVDLGLLDLMSCDTCVAGQVIPAENYVSGFARLDLDPALIAPNAVYEACVVGRINDDDDPIFIHDDLKDFDRDDWPRLYDSTLVAMLDAWKDQIKRRFDEGRVA